MIDGRYYILKFINWNLRTMLQHNLLHYLIIFASFRSNINKKNHVLKDLCYLVTKNL